MKSLTFVKLGEANLGGVLVLRVMVRRIPWRQRSEARARKSLGEATEPKRCFSKPHCLRASLPADNGLMMERDR